MKTYRELIGFDRPFDERKAEALARPRPHAVVRIPPNPKPVTTSL